MSERRRDNKNRILHQGESQLPDGRYRFKYKDPLGNERYVYSNRLVEHDPQLPNRKKEKSLREKEKEIELDLLDGVIPFGGNLTVLQLVEKYISIRTNIRWTTKMGYNTTLNFLKTDSFGSVRIDKVSTSDAKRWLINLQKNGKSYSSIHNYRGVIKPAFQMAYEDNLIKKNPFAFELAKVIYNDSITREALTRDQMRKFLDFVKGDNHFCKYYDAMYILFNTGLRISEFVGLTINEIDFNNHRIIVNHQLQRMSNMKYVIVDTKTEAGNRMIPMTPEVENCFKRIIASRHTPTIEPLIDGYSRFLYLDKNDMPMVALHWENRFRHAVYKYNSIYKVQMPPVTPHVCRHTFCSIMANSGMNPKKLQYLMGHSDITITLNTYSHIDYEEAKTEILRIMCS